MPQRAVSDRVRAAVRELNLAVDPETAQDIALAMVAGAAQGFLDITDDGRRLALQRLLAAMEMDAAGVLGALSQ